MSIKFEVVESYKNKDINLPKRGTSGSAGYDFEAAEDIIIPSFMNGSKHEQVKPTMVPTGIKAKMPSDVVLEINVRSSIGVKKLLMLPNQTGIIDSDYYNNPNNEGHIFIPLINLSNHAIEIKKGERIAQGIFLNYLVTDDDKVESIRNGGFGSTTSEGEFNVSSIVNTVSKMIK